MTGRRGVPVLLIILFMSTVLMPLTALRLYVPLPVHLEEEDGKNDETVRLLHTILVAELSRYHVEVSDTDYSAVLYSAFSLEEDGRLLFSLSVLAPAGDLLHFSSIRHARTGITLINAVSRMIEELLPALLQAGELPTLDSILPPPPFIDSFQILSPDEGARVHIGGEAPAAVVRDGKARIEGFPLLIGRSVPVELRKEGYRPLRVYFDTISEGAVYSFPPLEPKLRSAWTFSWSSARALGAGIGWRYFPVADWFFLGPEQYFYRRADRFGSATRLTAGSYIIQPPETPLRFGLLMAFEFDLELGEVTAIDTVFNFLTFFLEYRLGRITPYLQAELNYRFKGGSGSMEPGGFAALSAGVLLPGGGR